jgi:hypothetical protein
MTQEFQKNYGWTHTPGTELFPFTKVSAGTISESVSAGVLAITSTNDTISNLFYKNDITGLLNKDSVNIMHRCAITTTYDTNDFVIACINKSEANSYGNYYTFYLTAYNGAIYYKNNLGNMTKISDETITSYHDYQVLFVSDTRVLVWVDGVPKVDLTAAQIYQESTVNNLGVSFGGVLGNSGFSVNSDSFRYSIIKDASVTPTGNSLNINGTIITESDLSGYATGYAHSLITSGNPHSVTANEIGANNIVSEVNTNASSTLNTNRLSGDIWDGTKDFSKIDVDNLTLDGNTISSTDTNGNIVLSPNGTGDVVQPNIDARSSNVIAGTWVSAMFSDHASANDVLLLGNYLGGGATILAVNGALSVVTPVYLNCYPADVNGSTVYSRAHLPIASGYALGGSSNKWGSLYLDNILIDGNTISSTDTNGNIYLTPNGTGETIIDTFRIDPIQWDDLRVAAKNLAKAGVKDPGFDKFIDNGAGSTGLYSYAFDKATIEELFGAIQIPHKYKEGTNVVPHIHWMPKDTDTGVVRWGIEYVWTNIGDTTANSTIVYAEDAGDGTALKHQLAPFSEIVGTGKTISSMFEFRIFRDASDGNDTYDNDAILLEFDLHVQYDTLGSRTETTK